MATRHERVIIDLDDRFTADAARMAAAANLFKRNVDDSDRSMIKFDRTVKSTRPSIDQLSGRLAILTRTAAVLGPAFVPITTAAVPAVAGLATQLGFAAAAGGTAILAFQGVGDALSAVNDAHLEPTTANLQKAELAMAQLSPAAQQLVTKLHDMRGEFSGLRDAAASGLMPGIVDALDQIDVLFPRLESILGTIGGVSGDLISDGARSLASNRWAGFFEFIQTEAEPTLTDMAHTVGDLTHGLAELMMALGPLSSDFSSGLAGAADSFDRWASGLSSTEGFQDFLAYVRETGPLVVDALGSLANAILQIAEAAAPLGGPVLQAIRVFADTVAMIADSNLGTPIMAGVTALSAMRLATLGWGKAAETAAGQWTKASLASMRGQQTMMSRVNNIRTVALGGAAALGILAVAAQDTDGILGSTTTKLAAVGLAFGPWGAAIGGGIGALAQLADAGENVSEVFEDLNRALQGGDLDDIGSAFRDAEAEFSKFESDMTRLRDTDLSFGQHISRGAAQLKNGFEGVFGESDVEERAAELAKFRREYVALINAAPLSPGNNPMQIFGASIGETARTMEIAAADAAGLRREFELLNNALTGRASWRDYEAAIDGVKKALKENGKTLDITREKGRANQEALDSIASTSIKVAENLRGMDRVRFLRRARQDFVNAAIDLGMTRKQAQNLATDLGLLDRKNAKPEVKLEGKEKAKGDIAGISSQIFGLDRQTANPKVRVDTGGAYGQIDAIRRALSLIPDENVYIRTIQTGFAGQRANANDAIRNQADGGYISGPGGPRDDVIPAMLSNGEYVINAAATKRHRALLDQINYHRYADGGYVAAAGRSGSGGGSSVVVMGGHLTGTVDTPWGPAQLEGRMEQIAQSVMADRADMTDQKSRSNYGSPNAD